MHLSSIVIDHFRGIRHCAIDQIAAVNLLTGGNNVAVGQKATSDIAETISIYNSSAAPLPFHFFQYSDFNLGAPNGDSVFLWPNPDGLWNFARQTNR